MCVCVRARTAASITNKAKSNHGATDAGSKKEHRRGDCISRQQRERCEYHFEEMIPAHTKKKKKAIPFCP